jgi:hypothetical protein
LANIYDERVTERSVAACYNSASPLILSLDLSMSATPETSTPQKLCPISQHTISVEQKVKLGDCTYELFVGTCSCGEPIYKLMRTCGAALSIYQISQADYENLEDYIAELHASFAVDVDARMDRLRQTVHEFNSKGLFEAEEIDVFHVRLIDKARLILNRFAKTGRLQEILDNVDDVENDLAAAFLLGYLATENFWLEMHAEAVFEGYAHIEGRESGRPLAVAARLRQGKRTRRAVIEAASKLYLQQPLLRRNDSRTATLIAEMKLDALRKRDGTYLGSEAIAKHLRAARRDGSLGKFH